MRNIGIDLGRKPTVCEVANGQVVRRWTTKGLEELVRILGPGMGAPARVAFEACRESWKVAEWLEEWGHEPLLVDTTRTKQMGIGQHRRKNDRIDAEVLARAVEENRVPKAHLLSKHRQKLRRELTLRRTLVNARTDMVITIRSSARAEGFKLPSCGTDNILRRLEETSLPNELREAIQPLVEMLKTVEPQIAAVERRLEKLCEEEPIHEVLKTGPGTGPVVSAMYISVIDDPHRFKSAHEVESYLGLVPSEDTSGRRKLGSITKHGNSYLRALLVQAAWAVLRMRGSDPLKLWGEQVMARRGKRVAAVAVARRLAGILWAMWKRRTVYEPGRLGMKSAAGLEQQGQSTLVRAAALKRAAAKRLRPIQESEVTS